MSGASPSRPTGGSPGGRQRARVLPARPVRSGVVVLAFLLVLYAVELVDQLSPAADLDGYGISPRHLDGLDGILWAPLLHDGWGHLISNTVPLLVLGWLATSGGLRQFAAVTLTVWLVGGAGTWLVGADSIHIGASGVAFGWMVFLLVRGFFQRSAGQVLAAVVLFFFWGGMLWGLIPGQPHVSWAGHAFGALGGLLAAWLVARGDRSTGSRPAGSGSTGSRPAGSG